MLIDQKTIACFCHDLIMKRNIWKP